MGMFDDIKVPVSYLRGILDKKAEKLFNDDTVFQTKSLENAMFTYKVHRRQLYRSSLLNHDLWEKDTFTGAVDFYTSVKDDKETEHWFDFKFVFKAGKLDSKEFVGTHQLETKEERVKRQAMWEVEQQYFDDYKKRFYIRIWDKMGILFTRLGTYAQSKTQIPYKVRERAYNASGRLADDPTALDQFKK